MMTRYFFLLFSIFFTTISHGQLKQIDIGNAIINYTDHGTGTPVVFIHGGVEDYRVWEPQINLFSNKYRVITYSRRFNYPNQNSTEVITFSGETEADDLAAMIKKLNLQPVHLAGHSFGGLVALVFAKKYPQLTRSLILSEPPLINLLPSLPGGQDEYDKFYNQLWRPVKIAFDLRDTADVLRHTLMYFSGDDLSGQLPPEIRSMIIANFPEWKALANSPSAFTAVTEEDLRNLKMPVMVITAGKTLRILELTNPVLIKSIPQATHFHLPDGTHDFWMTHPDALGNAVLNFINTGEQK